ncbi:MAG: TetR/AcrR family transcriptional regulator [Smithellaceae bacterium]
MKMLKDEIRDQIIMVAREEFYQKGFQNASMRVIAEKAEVSVSNIYNYFTSKEEIFYALTDTVSRSLDALVKNLLNFREGKDFDDERFLELFTEMVPVSVFSLIQQYRIELKIIIEGSAGTKYADVKNTLIETLATYFNENMRQTVAARGDAPVEHFFLMRVLAMNLVNGLIEIAKQYQNDAWAEENIKALMSYHIRGMVQFFG